jgi:glycosyltransferase involved in cell wall biosynthesis
MTMPVHRPSKIQVIHFSTGYKGGAGLAARRLNESLNASGFESYFGAISQKGYSPSSNEFEIPRNALGKIISVIGTRLQLILSDKVFFSLISINVLPKKIITLKGNKNNTILHFHNWFNLTNQKEIIRWAKRGYKVVVTMHDQRMMTGGCHYAFSCKRFYAKCESCPGLPKSLKNIPNLNLEKLKDRLNSITGKITFISPSNWLDNEAKHSNLLHNQNTVFIPNTLGILKDSHREFALRSLSDTLNIGIASMEPKSYIKGGDITSSVEKLIKEHQVPINFHHLRDFSQTNQGLQDFWSKIDYLLVISRADNSPNVIHEAKQRGVPIIASKVGGITELLDSHFDVGLELSDCTESSLLDVLKSLIGKELNSSLRKSMQSRYHAYSNSSVADHISLYENLFAESTD